MIYPEYDSPFSMEYITENIAKLVAKDIDDKCYKAVMKANINFDRDKFLEIMRMDSERYREAFRKGKETGYTRRDEEIIRCMDCKWRNTNACFCQAPKDVRDDWFCSEGELKD